ncbi:MAG: PUR family DNA/RNA-binding protein [Bacteroidales bacterium]|jgi:hypothetical protein|nr:PUR family DNA/RNA-binding protein [Bacteroidales bacterium]
MENSENNSLLSLSLRAGKRTYFFDVKETRKGDKYLSITESKRKNNTDGTFYFEKHKLFLYNEDFDKFLNSLIGTIDFVKTGKMPEIMFDMEQIKDDDIRFEDLEE